MSKSRVYTQDDNSKVSFEFGADQKLIGIRKDGNSLDPQTLEFENLQDGDDALNAYNVNKFGGNVAAYEEIIDVDTDILISQHEREEKKETNGQFVEEDFDSPAPIAYNTGSNVGDYERDERKKYIFFGKKVKSDIMAYPVDIDPSRS